MVHANIVHVHTKTIALLMVIILTCLEFHVSYNWRAMASNCLHDASRSHSNTYLASNTTTVCTLGMAYLYTVRPHLDY